MIPILLLAWELLSRPVHQLRGLAGLPVRWFLLVPVPFYLLWSLIPKSGNAHIQSPANILANLQPFLQALVYPVLPFYHLSSDDFGWLVFLSISILTLTFAIAQYANAVKLWSFALIWVLLTALPSIMFLDPLYLHGGPRLFYYTAVSVVLLWGLPVLLLARLSVQSLALRLAAVAVQCGLLLAIAVPPLPYISCELDFYAQTSHLVRLLRDTTADAPVGKSIAYLNLPLYYSSYAGHPSGCTNPYPLAPVGSVIFPQYSYPGDFVYVNGGPDRQVSGFSFAGYQPGWITYGDALSPEKLHSILASMQVYVFNLPNESFFDLSKIWQPGAAPVGNRTAVFGESVALEKSSIDRQNGKLGVTLYWRALAMPQRPLTVFVHLVDHAGNRVGQHDGPPAANYAPAQYWEPGDLVIDTHLLSINAPLKPGTYSLVVGIYDSATTQRLHAVAADGKPLDGDVF